MRIAFIDDEPEIYPHSYGGKARTIRTLANALANTPSVDKVLIASRSIRDSRKIFYEEGVQFQLLEGYGIASELRRITHEYDIVNVHTCSFTFPQVLDTPARIINHLHDVIYATCDAGSHLDKALGGQWSGIIAPSEFAAQTARNVGWWNLSLDDIAVIPRIIDANRFFLMDQSAARQALAEVLPKHAQVIRDSYPLLAFPNRPTAGKGGAILAELHELLREEFESPLIITTGGDSDSHAISSGWLQTNQLRALYAAADICLVPSLLPESFSQVPLEAVMCGTPTISTRFGNLGLLADTVPGIYEAKPSAAHIRERVHEVLAEGKEAAAEGRTRIMTQYSARSVIVKLLAAYDSMPAHPKPAVTHSSLDARWFTSPLLAVYGTEAFLGTDGLPQAIALTENDRSLLQYCARARTQIDLSRSGLEYTQSVRRLSEAGALIKA